jgi:hypothetical protein
MPSRRRVAAEKALDKLESILDPSTTFPGTWLDPWFVPALTVDYLDK